VLSGGTAALRVSAEHTGISRCNSVRDLYCKLFVCASTQNVQTFRCRDLCDTYMSIGQTQGQRPKAQETSE